jgi:hypothetical protein
MMSYIRVADVMLDSEPYRSNKKLHEETFR